MGYRENKKSGLKEFLEFLSRKSVSIPSMLYQMRDTSNSVIG